MSEHVRCRALWNAWAGVVAGAVSFIAGLMGYEIFATFYASLAAISAACFADDWGVQS